MTEEMVHESGQAASADPMYSKWHHVRTFERHDDCVNSVAFNPDGKYIVSGSMGTTMKLWG